MRRGLRTAIAAGVAVALAGTGSAQAQVDPLSPASGPSPFAPGCNGAPQDGVEFRNAEVEPFVSTNPTDEDNLVGVWQQDRYSTGGANGNVTVVSRDGGRSWTLAELPTFKPLLITANNGDTANRTDAFSTTVSSPLPLPAAAPPRSTGGRTGQHGPGLLSDPPLPFIDGAPRPLPRR